MPGYQPPLHVDHTHKHDADTILGLDASASTLADVLAAGNDPAGSDIGPGADYAGNAPAFTVAAAGGVTGGSLVLSGGDTTGVTVDPGVTTSTIEVGGTSDLEDGDGQGGDIVLTGGNSKNSSGGGITLETGGDIGAGSGGDIELRAGFAGGGALGATIFAFGGFSSGEGGSVSLGGGAAAAGSGLHGGDIVLEPGAGNGAGRHGTIVTSGIPTTDPGVAGALWLSGGQLVVSGFTPSTGGTARSIRQSAKVSNGGGGPGTATFGTAPLQTSLLVCLAAANGNGLSSLTQTNVTWTLVRHDNVAAVGALDVWVGVPTGVPGTTVNGAGMSGSASLRVFEVTASTFSAAGQNVYAGTTAKGTTNPLRGVVAGHLVAMVVNTQGAAPAGPCYLVGHPSEYETDMAAVNVFALGTAMGNVVQGFLAGGVDRAYTLVELLP